MAAETQDQRDRRVGFQICQARIDRIKRVTPPPPEKPPRSIDLGGLPPISELQVRIRRLRREAAFANFLRTVFAIAAMVATVGSIAYLIEINPPRSEDAAGVSPQAGPTAIHWGGR